jgi:peptidoglycan/LPS O-acetylase OafA/YrhL
MTDLCGVGVGDRIIPEIQGLRAISAIAVVLFHMGWLWCGWLGVWVFFVVSAFVIMRSLQHREPAESFTRSLRHFYRSRVARIAPLYLFIIGVGVLALLVQATVGNRPDQLRFLSHVPWLLTGSYNVFRALPGQEDIRLFGHLWSLSVEEQFYLLFPLLAFGLRRRLLILVLFGLVVAGPIIRASMHLGLLAQDWTMEDVATAIYMLPFAHLDAFAVGALLALYEGRLRKLAGTVWARRLAWAGLVVLAVLVLACVAALNLQLKLTGKDIVADAFSVEPRLLSHQLLVYPLGVSCAAVVILLILCDSQWVRLLRAKSLVRLGGLSFGLYVYHFPLLWLFDGIGHRTIAGAAVYFAALLTASVLSRRYLEEPARHWLLKRRDASGDSTKRSPTSAVQSPARP